MDINIKEKTLKKFDSEASTYEQTSNGKFCSRIYPVILEKVNKKEYQIILDIGCGNGIVLSQMSESKSLYGLDLSVSMITQAKNKLGNKAELIVGDAEDLPWADETFDTILCTFSFHHYPQPLKVLREMYRALKIGGHLILADPWLPAPLRQLSNLVIPYSNSGDFHQYSKREISLLLKSSGLKLHTFEHPTLDTFLLVAFK